MRRIGAYEAKTHLPRLLDEVAGGQVITITKHGVAVAVLGPVSASPTRTAHEAIAALMFVVDASVALAWCPADESSELAGRALDRLEQDEALAPAIWPLEVANGLRTAERRGRLDLADMAHVRELLVSLPIEVASVPLDVALGEVTELARQLDLTAYDAAYLALAARHGVALATVDARLRRACERAGVELVG
jgi:prevent-host-death family protein